MKRQIDWRVVESGMESFGNENPLVEVTRTELTPAQTLLGWVIALASSDCKQAIAAVEQGKLTARALSEAASACAFFLSQEGQGMIAGVMADTGLGIEGIRAGKALAYATLRALEMSPAEVNHPTDYWVKVIEKVTLPESSLILRRLEPRPKFELVAA